MSEKITQEELQQIHEIKAEYNKIVVALGELPVRKEMLLSAYKNLAAQEQDLLGRLNIKYGNGSIDFNTGEITKEDVESSGDSESVDSKS
jgi:hypothetical protein